MTIRPYRLVRAHWWRLQRNATALWTLYVALLFAVAVYLRLHHAGVV